jgi:hypothetical protein
MSIPIGYLDLFPRIADFFFLIDVSIGILASDKPLALARHPG